MERSERITILREEKVLEQASPQGEHFPSTFFLLFSIKTVYCLYLCCCAHFQRLEAIYERLSRRRKSLRRWLSEEALGTIALGASARIGPLRRELVKAFREGQEEGRLK